MLYILSPTAPLPWDLIINFHRKGYHENICSSSIPRKTIKDSLNYDKRDQQKCIQTRNFSPTDKANVRQKLNKFQINRYFRKIFHHNKQFEK